MQKQTVKRQSKSDKMVRDFIARADRHTIFECVIQTMLFPIILIIFLFVMVVLSHEITLLTFIKELFNNSDYVVAVGFVLAGVLQSIAGVTLVYLGKIIAKKYSLVALYPSKNGLRHEVNSYWSLTSLLTVYYMPMLLPVILITQCGGLNNGVNTIIALGVTFAIFYITKINWDEMWSDKLLPRNNAKMFTILKQ